MPKLPDNTIRFDSPLRRTASKPAAPAVAQAAADAMSEPSLASPEAITSTIDVAPVMQETPVIELPRTRREIPTETAATSTLEHRITVRVDDDINRALELERHERRLAGEKTNVADVARKVLAAWAKRRLARDRS